MNRVPWIVALAIACAGPAAPAFAQESIAPEGRLAEILAPVAARAQAEVAAGRVPGLSIAVVDDQRVVWARGFGLADPERKLPATAETVYRVGSVSKLFADLAAMRLVEAGKLDLDAPIQSAIPGLAPANPYGKPITLRLLMSHRAGLVRETPIGSYFDAEPPDLGMTVMSLNDTALVAEPDTVTKYSNAGVAAVGLAVESVDGRPFEVVVRDDIFKPLGMATADFERNPAIDDRLAAGLMWSLDGRTWRAPEFALGTSPAGNLYASALDLSKALAMLFAEGRGPSGPIVRPETLRSMYEPVSGGPFGLGFQLGKLGGRKRIGHGGAVYGFSTEVAALPEEKLGVVVIANRDVSNALVNDIAQEVLARLLADRGGEPFEPRPAATALPAGLAQKLEGSYRDATNGVVFDARGSRLYSRPLKGGLTGEVRRRDDGSLAVDDAIALGPPFTIAPDGSLKWGARSLRRLGNGGRPAPSTSRFDPLIGEYGPDHNILYILEHDGRLFALIEWFFLDPLEERADGRFAFPTSAGLYPREFIEFERDTDGRATAAIAAGVRFDRRPIRGEDGSTFKIEPLRPVDELLPIAKAATPPAEPPRPEAPPLVDLTDLDPTIRLDIRYATADNFLGTPVYDRARARLRRPAAQALARAHRRLADHGLGLLIHDAYRPWFVTKLFYDATPAASRDFVADPSQGSRHNRGAAVDLTLCDLATGKPIAMVSGYDEFSDRARPDYPGGTALARWHRDLLRDAMEAEGFAVNEIEWWHFDYRGWRDYPILNEPFPVDDRPAAAGPR